MIIADSPDFITKEPILISYLLVSSQEYEN